MSQSFLERAQAMESTNSGYLGTKRARAILLPVFLALFTAYAQAGTFADAVDTANSNSISAGVGSYSTIVDLTVDDETLAGNDSQFGGWRLHGTNDSTGADPSATDVTGFLRVTLTGRAGGTTLDGNGRNSTVLSVLHAQDLIAIENLIITGGGYSAANAGGNKIEVAGGGLLLGGNGFLNKDNKAAATINVSDSTITGNSLTITGGNTTRNVFGAGVAVNGAGVSGGAIDYGNLSAVTFSGVDITNNSLRYTRSTFAADQESSVRGGGGRIGYAESFHYNGGTVSGNSVVMQNGGQAAGGGLSVDGNATYRDVAITGVHFLNNSVEKSGLTFGADSLARGGAFYYYNGANTTAATVTLNGGTTFIGNSATAGSSGSDVNAEGGAVFVMLDATTVDVDGVVFTDNSAASTRGRASGGAIMADSVIAANAESLQIHGSTFENNSATGTSIAQGGAVAANHGSVTIDARSVFTGNTANATGSTGRAQGGAAYLAGDGARIANSTFSGNKADGSQYAQGGGIYLGSGTHTVEGTVISGNTATSDSNAQGGGIFAEAGVLNIVNSSIVNNRATVETRTTGAYGSAIFMDLSTTPNTGTAVVNLEATNTGDKVVIENNKTNGDYRVSGIHFGSSSGAASRYSAELNISGQGEVILRNPVTATITSSGRNLTINKTGTGTLTWDGWNEFNVLASTVINLDGGRVNLGQDFTARAIGSGSYTVNITSSGSGVTEIHFDSARDETTAMFDFRNSGAKTFNVESGTKLVASVGRQVKSSQKEYIVASGLDKTTLDQLAIDFDYVTDGSGYLYVDNKLTVDGDKLIAGLTYRSPFDNNANSRAAQNALESLLQGDWGREYISDAEYEAMRSHAGNVVPELFMEQGFVMLENVDRVSRSAMDFGLRYPHRNRMKEEGEYMPGMMDTYGQLGIYSDYAYPSLAGDYCEPTGGLRMWTGYIGDWRNQDSHGGYNGYRMDRHGVLVGLNYDFDTMASVGIYGGYTSSTTRAQSADSKVGSDVGHIGLQARWSPLSADRGLSFFVDGGYHWSSNDIERHLGGWNAAGSFDQKVVALGVGVEYVVEMENATIIPHFEGRYFNIDQDAMQESGSSHTITNVAGFDKSAFNTRFGVEFTREYLLGDIAFSPSLNIDWRHEYGTRRASGAARFISDPFATPFTVSSSRQDRDSLDLGFSLKTFHNFGASQIGFNLAYNLNLSRNSDTHSVFAGLEYGF